MGNAIKFTPKGSVACSCKLVGYGRDDQGEDSVFLEFCVADTGIGIKVGAKGYNRLHYANALVA